MKKFLMALVLFAACAFFTMSVFYTPYQEVFFQFIPKREPMTTSFGSLAFMYTGLGLITAILVGLLDRVSLLLLVKKLEKEKNEIKQQTEELRSLLVEDRESSHE